MDCFELKKFHFRVVCNFVDVTMNWSFETMYHSQDAYDGVQVPGGRGLVFIVLLQI